MIKFPNTNKTPKSEISLNIKNQVKDATVSFQLNTLFDIVKMLSDQQFYGFFCHSLISS